MDMFPYQDFSRKSSSFDFRVGIGMIILLSTGRRRFGRQAGGISGSGRAQSSSRCLQIPVIFRVLQLAHH
jgi:hypothetical protein